MAQISKYRRAVLKLSGEALTGEKEFGINPVVIKSVIEQVTEIAKMDCKTTVIVDDGNIWRGKTGSNLGMNHGTADYTGMFVTVMNALALQGSLEQLSCDTRILISTEMKQVTEPHIRRRTTRYLEKKHVVIFAAGVENLYFSTNATATLYVAEVEVDVILMGKNNIDGVYSADSKVNRDAVKYEHLTHIQMLQEGLQVVDSAASSSCVGNNILLTVFPITKGGNTKRAVMGEKIGTLITK